MIVFDFEQNSSRSRSGQPHDKEKDRVPNAKLNKPSVHDLRTISRKEHSVRLVGTLFSFHKNILYKNIEAEIGEI